MSFVLLNSWMHACSNRCNGGGNNGCQPKSGSGGGGGAGYYSSTHGTPGGGGVGVIGHGSDGRGDWRYGQLLLHFIHCSFLCLRYEKDMVPCTLYSYALANLCSRGEEQVTVVAEECVCGERGRER